MSRSRKGIAALVFSCVAGGGLVVSAAKPVVDVPVLAMLQDVSQGYALQVGSDGGGSYINATQGGVSSLIHPETGGSEWMFYTYATTRPGKFAPTLRGIRFNLSDQDTYVQNFPTPIAPDTVWPAYVLVRCSQVNVDMLSMPLNSSADCPGSFRFWKTQQGNPGTWYRLAFNPDNYPVNPLKVTCVQAMAAPATGCKTWSITPAGTTLRGSDPNPKNHTTLLEIDDGGNVLRVGGTYYVSFAMTITR